MKKINMKKFAFWLTASAVGIAPVALAASCGTSDSTPEAKKVTIDAKNLAKVTLSGDAHDITFNVPNEVIKIDDTGALSPSGTIEAFKVYGRTTITDLGGSALATNTNFMPLDLLTYYLSGKLAYDSKNTLIANTTPSVTDVVKTFGESFGFSKANINIVKRGLWPANAFELKYVPNSGYTADAQQLSASIKPDTTTLNDYVSLDTSWIANIGISYFSYPLLATHDKITWTRSLSYADLPASWKDYVQEIRYSTSNVFFAATSTVTIPDTTSATPEQRNLFVHFVPKQAKTSLSIKMINVTAASKLRAIHTKLDSITPGYDTTDLSRIVLSASDNRLVLTKPQGLVQPESTKLVYQVDGLTTSWLEEADMLNALTTSAKSTAPVIKARFTVIDSGRFVLADVKENTITTRFLGFINTTPDINLALGLGIDVPQSTPSSVKYANTITSTSALPSVRGISNYGYLLSNTATTEATALAANGWVPTIPTSFVYDQTKPMNLWFRLYPKDNYILRRTLVNLTATSHIQDVLNSVDVSAFENQTLSFNPATSVNNDIKWNVPTLAIPSALSSSIASFEYLAGNYATAEAAASAQGWVRSAPTSMPYTTAERNLWVRLNSAAGYRLSRNIINWTDSSSVRLLKSKVDSSPLFSAVDLTKVVISGSPSALLIYEEAVNLPAGTNIYYSHPKATQPNEYLLRSDFIARVNANSSLFVDADLANFKARLGVANTTSHVIENVKEAAPNTSTLGMNGTRTATPQAAVDIVNQIGYTSTSTPQSITWNTVPSPVAPVASFQYLSGNYPSLLSILAQGITWSNTLPSSVSLNPAERNIWVKIVATPGISLLTQYYEITTTSNIRNLPLDLTTSVDAAANYINTNLSFAATSTHAAVAWNPISLSSVANNTALKVEYLYDDTVLTTTAAASSTSWVNTLPSGVNYVALKRKLYVRVSALYGTPYSKIIALPVVANIKSSVDLAPEYAAIDLSAVVISGTFLNATIGDQNITLPQGVEIRYQIRGINDQSWMTSTTFKNFLKDNVASATQASLGTIYAKLFVTDENKWVLVDSKEERPNLSLLALYIVVDVPQTIITSINQIKYATGSTPTSLSWVYTPVTPSGAISRIEFLSGAYFSEPVAVAAPEWASTLPTSVDAAPSRRALWVRVVPTPGYLLTLPSVFDITDSSGIREVTTNADALLATYRDYITTQFKAGSGSTPSNVIWNYPLPDERFTPVFTISYLSSDDPTILSSLATQIGWSATLPSTINADTSKRVVVARIELVRGYTVTAGANMFIDLSSKVAAL